MYATTDIPANIETHARPHHQRSRSHRRKKLLRKGLLVLLFLVFLVVLARFIAGLN